MEVSPEILEQHLGKEITDILSSLRPALLAYDVTHEHTAFFLDHQQTLLPIRAFIKRGYDGNDSEGHLPPAVRWYLRELRSDLIEIFQSDALKFGWASHFAIYNHSPSIYAINPRHWHPDTLAFIQQHIRPVLRNTIKPKYIDDWLQTPLDLLGELSPIQMIEYGGGERVKAIVEEMAATM